MSTVTVGAAFMVGAVALLILALQPILLGSLIQSGVIGAQGLGVVATIETLALGIASGISPRYLARGSLRVKVALFAAILVGIDVATGRAITLTAIVSLRACAGILEGALLGATVLTILQGASPDRLNAVFLALSAIPQAVGAYLLPVLIIPAGGTRAGFNFLGATAAVALLSAWFISLPRIRTSGPNAPPLKLSVPIVVALVAIFSQNAAIGAAWNYVEQVADDRSFGEKAVAIATSGNICLQVIGALLVAWIGWRIPFRFALIAGTLIQGIVLTLLALGNTSSEYISACLAFGFLWLAMSPFQLRLLIALDETRSAATLSVAVTLLGLATGPLAAALFVESSDVTSAFWVAAVFMAMAALLYALSNGKPVSEGAQTGTLPLAARETDVL